MGTFVSRKEQPLTTCILHCPRNQTTAECSCQTLLYGFGFIFYFFFKERNDWQDLLNISHFFFVFLLLLVLGTLPQPQFCWAAASLQSIFIFQGLFRGRIEQRQREWSLFYGYFTHAGLKIGSFQRVLLALNQPPLVGGIPAPALDRAMQEGNPLNAAAGQSSTPWDFQQKI